MIIDEAIWDNRDARKNLGYPFLIYQLCKNSRVEVSNQDEWVHPIKAIVVKWKGNRGVLEPETNIDSSHESINEEE